MYHRYTHLINAFAFILITIGNVTGQQFYIDQDTNKHLLDKIEIAHLQEAPYQEWFDQDKQDISLDGMKSDFSNLKDIKVKIFMATWCGDTKRHFPEFIKIWSEAGLSEDQLEIVAVHRDGEEYKRSPSRYEADYNLHRVPTFVFEKDGKEIGRIVERPKNDMITDVRQISLGVPSKSRYEAVTMLNDYFQENNADSLFANLGSVFRPLYRNVASSSELNTYGYVLKAANKMKEAEVAFYLNTRFFQYNPNVHDSMGEYYMDTDKPKAAKVHFEKVLKLKGEDERASEMLATIEKLASEEGQ